MANLPSGAITSAGTTLQVGLAPATYDAAGFSAVTYNSLGEITDMGEYGKKYKLVTHNPIGTRNTVKRRGSYDNGTMTLKTAWYKTDAGQNFIQNTALASDASIAVKITLQNGTINYFTAQVLSYTKMIGNVDTITGSNIQLELDNDIIEI